MPSREVVTSARRLLSRTLLLVAAFCSVGSLATVQPASGVAGFGDVGADRFYTDAIQWMVDNGITTGTSPACFAPEAPVTRGQAAVFLWRMEGSPEPGVAHRFRDVVEPWQHDAVSWMSETGVTTGTSATSFSPERILTRGEFAALLWRLAGRPAAVSSHGFGDVVEPWQHDAVSWMSRSGITTGTSPSTYSPQQVMTRGQLAAFLYRYEGRPAVAVDADHPAWAGCVNQTAAPPDESVAEPEVPVVAPDPPPVPAPPGARLGVSSPHVGGTTVGERVTSLESGLGAGEFGAVRLYHAWDEWFPQGSEQFLTDPGRDTVPVLSVGTKRANGQRVWWSSIADAQPGSPLHNEMVRWADDLRDFGRPIVVTLDHEPDHYRNGGSGVASEYRRAHQAFVSVLRSRGATNVEVGFVGVAWNFDPRSPVDVTDYYPGDAWVDVIGVDGYNWGTCADAGGTWRTFDQIFAPFLTWTAAHPGKAIMIAEFGVTEKPGSIGSYKQNWLRDATASLNGAQWDRLEYILAWDNLWEVNNNCDFRVSSSTPVRTAFRDMMHSPVFD